MESNSTLKHSGLNDSKDFPSFCQDHCEKSVLVLDICGANQLNIRRESHSKSSFDCIYCFVSKSWAVQTALGFSLFSLLRSPYQVPGLETTSLVCTYYYFLTLYRDHIAL